MIACRHAGVSAVTKPIEHPDAVVMPIAASRS